MALELADRKFYAMVAAAIAVTQSPDLLIHAQKKANENATSIGEEIIMMSREQAEAFLAVYDAWNV
jgi:hypothetical protein